jgi:hypothetical protein
MSASARPCTVRWFMASMRRSVRMRLKSRGGTDEAGGQTPVTWHGLGTRYSSLTKDPPVGLVTTVPDVHEPATPSIRGVGHSFSSPCLPPCSGKRQWNWPEASAASLPAAGQPSCASTARYPASNSAELVVAGRSPGSGDSRRGRRTPAAPADAPNSSGKSSSRPGPACWPAARSVPAVCTRPHAGKVAVGSWSAESFSVWPQVCAEMRAPADRARSAAMQAGDVPQS